MIRKSVVYLFGLGALLAVAERELTGSLPTRKLRIGKTATLVGALAMLFGTTLPAQNLAGEWQGTLKAGSQEIRVVLAIDKSADGKWVGTFTSPDQSPDWGARAPIDSIALQGATLKFAIAAARASYEGKLSADGKSFEGTWSQGRPLPLSSGAQLRRRHGKTRRHILFSS